MDLEKFYLWSSIASFFVAIFIIIQLFLPNRPPEPPIPATQVIAHRGYWLKAEGLQNSLQSLHEAMKIGIYGSEFDVHMTADSQLIVFHDNMLDTIEDIRKANYENIHVHGLFNDLFIPTLADYFELGNAVYALWCIRPDCIDTELQSGGLLAEEQTASDRQY